MKKPQYLTNVLITELVFRIPIKISVDIIVSWHKKFEIFQIFKSISVPSLIILPTSFAKCFFKGYLMFFMENNIFL